MFFRRTKRDPAESRTKPGDGMLLLSGDWTADIWDRKPIRVPAAPDVGTFLGQRPMPSLWPDDREFNDFYADGGDEVLRRLWIMALFHHPERDVVVQTLRSPHLESVSVHAVPVADLVIDSPVAEEAAEAVWRMTDDAVTVVLNVVLNRGLVASGHSPAQADRAIELLRSTCPADRLAFFEAEAVDEFERTAQRLVELTSAAERGYGGLGAEERERWHRLAYVDGLIDGGPPPEGFAERVEIRAIGHRLNEEGGFPLMRSVAERAGQLSDRRMAERRLNMHWNHIGEWMS
ncbi:hypothetical protein E1293_17130 [Actinomadura darangshiensis]|uniref:Uncharacterized protein n=1 Tax=Actinomadura darangshiensis TaxID=705336 RepID=A0A4R5B879_9ACTN|nr:hypothetical protein [Actinomadura darangshiensis]TDD82171.1 hypothetical protein E1293_17130 [Actinomadura darangshiensis]